MVPVGDHHGVEVLGARGSGLCPIPRGALGTWCGVRQGRRDLETATGLGADVVHAGAEADAGAQSEVLGVLFEVQGNLVVPREVRVGGVNREVGVLHAPARRTRRST